MPNDGEIGKFKFCSSFQHNHHAMAMFFLILQVRDVVQPPGLVTSALKRKKIVFTWSGICPSLQPVYNPVKHKIFASPITLPSFC